MRAVMRRRMSFLVLLAALVAAVGIARAVTGSDTNTVGPVTRIQPDGRQRGHNEGSGMRAGNANVCQNTTRRNPRSGSEVSAANAFAP